VLKFLLTWLICWFIQIIYIYYSNIYTRVVQIQKFRISYIIVISYFGFVYIYRISYILSYIYIVYRISRISYIIVYNTYTTKSYTLYIVLNRVCVCTKLVRVPNLLLSYGAMQWVQSVRLSAMRSFWPSARVQRAITHCAKAIIVIYCLSSHHIWHVSYIIVYFPIFRIYIVYFPLIIVYISIYTIYDIRYTTFSYIVYT
jgi:hypothetical protein